MSDREHSGGCPAVGFEHLAVSHWTEESFPVPITHFPFDQVDRDLGLERDDPGEDWLRSYIRTAFRALLEWIDRGGHATASGAAIRIAVLQWHLNPRYEHYSQTKLCDRFGFSKQLFGREVTAFRDQFGGRDSRWYSERARAAYRKREAAKPRRRRSRLVGAEGK